MKTEERRPITPRKREQKCLQMNDRLAGLKMMSPFNFFFSNEFKSKN